MNNIITNKVNKFLESVSDETGEVQISKDYILLYEGWSHGCFEDIYDDTLDDEENDANFFEYAENETPNIINKDWIPKMKRRNFIMIDGGYVSDQGLYGVTWAVFNKKK